MKVFSLVFLVVLGMILVHRASECRPVAPPRPTAILTTYAVAEPPHAAPAALDQDQDPDAGLEREPAEGLPVPIYPGTRVTEAEIRPPQRRDRGVLAPGTLIREHLGAASSSKGPRTVSGQLCATEPRARANARLHLVREVADWLAPDVPAAWRPPAHLVDRLITRTRIEPVVRDYGTLYEATLEVDLTPARRAEVLAVYQHQLVNRRMLTLGGGLGFILACLAALSGYIRADEATKGYYTHWLRAIAAAGVGASGVLLYQLLA